MQKIIKNFPLSISKLHSQKAFKQKKPKKSPIAVSYLGFNNLEIWSNNSLSCAYFFSNLFAFRPIFFSNSYTGNKNFEEFVLKNGKVFLSIKSPILPENSAFQKFLGKHGDTIKKVVIFVKNLKALHENLLRQNVDSRVFTYNSEQQILEICLFGQIVYKFVQSPQNIYTSQPPKYLKPVDSKTGWDTMNKLLPTPEYNKIDHVGFPQFP